MQCTVVSLLDTGTDMKLVNSLPSNQRSYAKPVKALIEDCHRARSPCRRPQILRYMYQRPRCTRMSWCCRELCNGPITLAVKHLLVYRWHLLNWTKARGNTLSPIAVLTSLPRVIWLMHEDVQDEAMAYDSRKLKYHYSFTTLSPTIQPYTQACITVTSPAAALLLIASPRDMVEKHQSMNARRTRKIFLARPFQVYVAHLPTKLNLLIKDMVFSYTSKAPEYIVRSQREAQIQSSRRKKALA